MNPPTVMSGIEEDLRLNSRLEGHSNEVEIETKGMKQVWKRIRDEMIKMRDNWK